jgi:4-alpha-glucanotransferase
MGSMVETQVFTLAQRGAGVLLHPTSLPGDGPFGELGNDALRFIDFLAAAGQRIWQVLPLSPVHEDLSPYQSFSAFAGNPNLVGRHWLMEELPHHMHDEHHAQLSRMELVRLHYQLYREAVRFAEQFRAFCAQHAHWLDDYAMFRVLKDRFDGKQWNEWPVAYRDRQSDVLAAVRREKSEQVDLYRFEQFFFYRQWHRVRHYANERGIAILGDMPIFVAYDSADVWTQRCAFLLDDQGEPTVVTGVPPDYFSATGQRWGNPHYDWEWMEADGFSWWKRRVAQHLELYNMFRVDHFRGFESSWEIPVYEETAINGRWIKVPGEALFTALQNHFGEIPILAEDLGIITPEVTELRRKFHFPGMLILQFAFDGQKDNPYLPHNHTEDSVVYTGTHDNDTTLGWFSALPEWQQQHVMDYLGFPHKPMPWPLIESAYSSVARQAIIPMQDILALGSEHRMNIPGMSQGNWRWQFTWDDVTPEVVKRLRNLTGEYARAGITVG